MSKLRQSFPLLGERQKSFAWFLQFESAFRASDRKLRPALRPIAGPFEWLWQGERNHDWRPTACCRGNGWNRPA